MGKRYKRFKKIMKFSDAHRGWPIVTCVLIGICVSVFIIQVLVPKGVWVDHALMPANALSRPWTFVTYIFLHSSLTHLIFNLTFFVFFGYCVETAIGRKGLLIAFLSTGILGGFVGILITSSTTALVGASGAIMGVAGFLAAIYPAYPVRFFFFPGYRPAIFAVIFYGLFDLIYLFASDSQVASAAHLAGLIAGILLGLYWRIRKSQGFT